MHCLHLVENEMSVFDDFKTHGINASYHYADDTASGEWRLGSIEEAKALKIFDANPDDQEKMREIAKGFLWSLNSKRPKATISDKWTKPEESQDDIHRRESEPGRR